MTSPNTQPIYPGAIKSPCASFATANTDKTGATGSTTSLYAATASPGQGALIQSITVTSTATTAAGVVCVFKYDGSTNFLLKEIAVTAVTSSASAAGFSSGSVLLNEFLQPGYSIKVSTTIAQTMHACLNVGEY